MRPSFWFFPKAPSAIYFAIYTIYSHGEDTGEAKWFNEPNFIPELPQTVRKTFKENISCLWLLQAWSSGKVWTTPSNDRNLEGKIYTWEVKLVRGR